MGTDEEKYQCIPSTTLLNAGIRFFLVRSIFCFDFCRRNIPGDFPSRTILILMGISVHIWTDVRTSSVIESRLFAFGTTVNEGLQCRIRHPMAKNVRTIFGSNIVHIKQMLHTHLNPEAFRLLYFLRDPFFRCFSVNTRDW